MILLEDLQRQHHEIVEKLQNDKKESADWDRVAVMEYNKSVMDMKDKLMGIEKEHKGIRERVVELNKQQEIKYALGRDL